MTTRLSNVEFVHDMMSFSKYGSLSQVFVVEALRYYCEQVLKTAEPEDDPKSMFSPLAWYKIAEEIQEKLVENYETNRNLSR
jgi:hypothetical protein